ncbi:MAG TPA: hypothetical protein VNW47_12585 [Terriglobales bacterium]|nr:hypothetical protein [Terriglobales bacterium]
MRRLPCVRSSGTKAFLGVVSFILLTCLWAMAGKDFVMPTAQAARTYPAHDDHPTEKLSVAVDPYDMADKAQIFRTNFNEYGYLPVFFIVTNDSDEPVALSGMKAQLITVDRTKLLPATSDDLVRRMARPARNDRPGVQLPIPLPGSKKVKGAVSRQTMDEISESQFGARSVDPHSTASGFLYFDVGDISTPLAGANFYVTGVRDSGGNELMYFEIPMEKYLSAPQAKKP